MSRQRTALAWNNEYCRHCFGCIAMCVRGALTLDHERGCLSYNIRKCIRCGNCLRACPTGALHVEPVTEE